MTIDEIADKLKKNEIEYDEEYLKAILREEKAAEQEIEYLLLLLWAGKIKKREFYNETNRIVEEMFSEIEEDMTVELEKRHREGYTEGAFLVQLLLGSFSAVSYSSKYNPKWHMNNGSFIDDLIYYKNRLIDDIRKEVERLRALKAPVESAISGITKPFKKLSNSTKAMVDTEMVYAERQGLKSAYMDHDAKKYRYLATLDGLTCERCAELDGKVFLLSEAVAGANYPPMHPFCRCTTIPVFSDFDTTKRYAKDENGETIEVSMAYDEWKATYAKDVNESSLRTKSGGENGVNWNVVKSKEYTERFKALSNNEKANELAAQRSRNALVNRTGKNTEELYAISLTTGKDVSSITDQHHVRGIKRTDKFMRDVARAESNGETVLLIHNHPNGTPPSIADLNSLLEHERAVGITVGHDGSIYYYTKPERKIEKADERVAFRKVKEYSGIYKNEKALDELAKQFGFVFRKL